MRDIGRRIERYRLSRYAHPGDAVRAKLHWLWVVALGWVVWAGLLSEHSFYRLWRMSRENARMEAEVSRTIAEIEAVERERTDPDAKRQRIEEALRVRMAREDEIVYRIRNTPKDSLPR